MIFLDREAEMGRLDRLAARPEGGLAVLFGRRRIGKTRLLVEWCRKHGGLYTVADHSAAPIQRAYMARGVAGRLAGFADVEYRDWALLLERLSKEARSAGWRGPLVLDEFPYLVATSPELPSVLQRFVDHEAKAARLVVAVAGSSQRMMQGLALSASAPLYGRASTLLEILPLDPIHLPAAVGCRIGVEWSEAYAAWGGVPRYWELAAEVSGSARERVEQLVLDPLGPLHREPDRLLLEEVPPAQEVRPLLEAIGAGVHRVSEIAGRLGRPATSMSRPLGRLVEMGLVRREVPFGEHERRARRALYRIDDPLIRLWFRVVAPNRSLLTSGRRADRRTLLERNWPGLAAEAWEDLCRLRISGVGSSGPLGEHGPWTPARRWWHGNLPEWDHVASSQDERMVLLGESKWSARPVGRAALDRMARALRAKAPPPMLAGRSGWEAVRALLVPALAPRVRRPADILVITAKDLVA